MNDKIDELRGIIPALSDAEPVIKKKCDRNVGEYHPESFADTLFGAPQSCLIVDDVFLNLKVLAALMRKLGCAPVMCASGKEALKFLEQNRVDLILTDLWMPEMNGTEFAMSIRQIPEYNDIPIVAVTADVERMENFDMKYFADTLIKPVNFETLKKTIVALRNSPPNVESIEEDE